MIAKQIIKDEPEILEIMINDLEIFDTGIADIIDDIADSILMPKEIGPTDYSGIKFKPGYQNQDIKGYGSFAEYLTIDFMPAEISFDKEKYTIR